MVELKNDQIIRESFGEKKKGKQIQGFENKDFLLLVLIC